MNKISAIENPEALYHASSNPMNNSPVVIPQPTRVIGVPFHPYRRSEALDLIERFITERIPRQVCLSNAFTVTLARTDLALRKLLQSAALVLADGMSIVWGARWIGIRLPERVAGPDVMEGLCERAEKKGYRVYLLGSSPDTLQLLQRQMLLRWPRLQIVGMHSPSMCESFSGEESRQMVDLVRGANPDILFVGMSCPKQEKWIAEHLQALGVPVALGVGAAFNFLSGTVPRAPERLQTIGLEWLYRLYREPTRLWKRYLLGNAVFLCLLVAQFVHWRVARWLRPRHA